MKKAMYRIMIDRLVVLMLHLLISAIMVMFLWLLLPLPFTVAAVCCMDITKHFAIYSHFRCLELDAMLSDVFGVLFGVAMVMVLT